MLKKKILQGQKKRGEGNDSVARRQGRVSRHSSRSHQRPTSFGRLQRGQSYQSVHVGTRRSRTGGGVRGLPSKSSSLVWSGGGGEGVGRGSGEGVVSRRREEEETQGNYWIQKKSKTIGKTLLQKNWSFWLITWMEKVKNRWKASEVCRMLHSMRGKTGLDFENNARFDIWGGSDSDDLTFGHWGHWGPATLSHCLVWSSLAWATDGSATTRKQNDCKVVAVWQKQRGFWEIVLCKKRKPGLKIKDRCCVMEEVVKFIKLHMTRRYCWRRKRVHK